jgi:hypothetical protein
MYDIPISINTDAHDILDAYYTALSEATEAACDRHYVKLDPQHLLYLFDYYKISKGGGANIPLACTQWPGIHRPLAIISVLDTKGLYVNFISDNGGE